ncbi:UDP-2,3-diacylglucosamine diphosphatase [Gallibacterium melopsittaci]|uniref:UDP-2,3-diacylglucosamine hydrolase n=1 Tax=Gallibacterium melopsittaci TaxID=516063 RepID=A0ABV6HX12_9PAST
MSKPTYFIADLHLSEHSPHLLALFRYFMTNLAPQAQALYILGDLFDFWVGDDEDSATIQEIKQLLRHLTAQGIPCYFCHGNRDFLVGERFAKQTGVQLLPEYHKIDLYGQMTLLCHGDTLCTDDVAYQKFRQRVHQRWLQKLFLCLPLNFRIRLAQRIRQQSQTDKQNKSAQIMDVNADTVEETFAKFQVNQLIHGHTHRQAVHVLENNRKRIVLGDWREELSVFVVAAGQEGYFLNLALPTEK